MYPAPQSQPDLRSQGHSVTIKDFVKYSIKAGVESGNGPEWDLLWRYRVLLMGQCQIINSDGSKHQAVIAMVRDDEDDEGDIFGIMIERCEHTDEMAETCTEKNGNLPAGGTSAKILPSILEWNTDPFETYPMASTDSTYNSDSQCRSSQKLLPANDIITMFPSNCNDDFRRLVFLRVFQPRKSLYLVRLGMIIEAVHDFMPYYEDFRGQSHWFALTVMGVSMIQGGDMVIKNIWGKNTASLFSMFSESYHSDLPMLLGLADAKHKHDRPDDPLGRRLAKATAASEKSQSPGHVIKASYQDILTIGDVSQQHLDSLDADLTPERADYMRPRLEKARKKLTRRHLQEVWEKF